MALKHFNESCGPVIERFSTEPGFHSVKTDEKETIGTTHALRLAPCDLPLATCPLRLATCSLRLAPCSLRLVPCSLLRAACCLLNVAALTSNLLLLQTRSMQTSGGQSRGSRKRNLRKPLSNLPPRRATAPSTPATTAARWVAISMKIDEFCIKLDEFA